MGELIDLSQFTKAGYCRGRNIMWQFCWHLFSNLCFQKFWFPGYLRPKVLRLFGAEVSDDVLIRSRVKIHWPWKLKMGHNVWIGEGVWLLNLEPICVGDSVCISQEAFLCTGSHDFKSKSFDFKNMPINISNSCWIGARAIVLAGSEIPAGTLVPAGTVYRRTS